MNKKYYILIFIFSISYLMLLNLNSSLLPSDDGFFYLQIAHNITNGFGSTFNQITSTNGYHPLWMLVCIILSFVSMGSKAILLKLALSLQFGLFLLSLYKIRKVTTNIGFYFSAFYLSLLFLSLGNMYLSEGFLLLYICIILYNYLINNIENISNLKLSLLLSLLILTRIDSLFVVFTVVLFVNYKINKFHFPNLIKQSILIFLIISPYFLYNYKSFGHLLTISAEIKSYFPNPIFNLLDYYGLVSILLNLCFAIYFIYKKQSINKLNYVFLVGVISQVFFIYLFNVGSSSWYWIISYICNALFINEFVKLFKIKIEEMYLLILTLIICFSLFTIRIYNYNPNKSLIQLHPCTTFVQKIETLIPNSKIITYDSPGRFAFFSNLSFISSDGLVCDFDYSNFIEQNGIEVFVLNNKINYIITPYSKNISFEYKRLKLNCYWKNNNFVVNFLSPLNDIKCGGFYFTESNLLFTSKSPLNKWEKGFDSVAVWKINL